MTRYPHDPYLTETDYARMAPMRKCHDCGKPTRDYRCAKCRRAHERKFHVSPQDRQLEDIYVY